MDNKWIIGHLAIKPILEKIESSYQELDFNPDVQKINKPSVLVVKNFDSEDKTVTVFVGRRPDLGINTSEHSMNAYSKDDVIEIAKSQGLDFEIVTDVFYRYGLAVLFKPVKTEKSEDKPEVKPQETKQKKGKKSEDKPE